MFSEFFLRNYSRRSGYRTRVHELGEVDDPRFMRELWELAHTPELRLADEPGVIALIEQLRVSPRDGHLRELFGRVMNDKAMEAMMSGDPFRGNYSPKGSLMLPRGILTGIMPTGSPVVVPFGADAGHLGIHAATRKGKSSLLRVMIPQAVVRGACVVVMTHKPGEFSGLLTLLGLRGCSRLFYWDELMLALTDPPAGLRKDIWAVDLVDLIARNYSLFASRRLLLGSLMNLYEKNSLEWLNLERWCKYLRGFETGKGLREEGYKESAWWTLQTLLVATAGKDGIFAYSRSNFLERLFSQPGLTVIEGQSLPPEHFSFLATYMVRWLYLRRLYGSK